MAGSITDLLSRGTDSTTGRPIIAQLASGKAIAAATVSLNTATNWTTSSIVPVAIYNVTAAGVKDPTSQTDWLATLSGTTLSNMTLTGGTDRVYNAGAYVEITLTSAWLKRLYDHLLTHTDQDGTLKAGAVDNAGVLASDVVTTTKILDSNVTAAKLATSAITLGYAQITGNFVTAATSATLVTGLTASVTIPAGGRRVRITAKCSDTNNTASAGNALTIWDGTVGSGTQLDASNLKNRVVGDSTGFMLAQAIVTPAAGAKTYNVGLHTNTGTATLFAGSTAPAFIHVEAI